MLSPQGWGEMVERGVRIKPFMDIVLQRDEIKYTRIFVLSLYKRGVIQFTHRPKDRITPFFVTKSLGPSGWFWTVGR